MNKVIDALFALLLSLGLLYIATMLGGLGYYLATGHDPFQRTYTVQVGECPR